MTLNRLISVQISINERGIFNVNVYIEMKTEFKILVYFITFLTPGKRVRTHSQEHSYLRQVYFFINPDTCVENSAHTVLCPFCAYAAYIHEAPGVDVCTKTIFFFLSRVTATTAATPYL